MMKYCPYCNIGIDNGQMNNRKCNNCLHEWEVYHVLPVNDIESHSQNYKCHCNPDVRNEGLNMICIHNSFDGREIIEEAINKTNFN